MTASDAFWAKQDAYEAVCDPKSQPFLRAFRDSYLRGDGPAAPWVPDTGTEFGPVLRGHLALAETFYVAPAMTALVTAAAEAWEPDEPVDVADFPTEAGFLWIHGGLTVLDVRGQVTVTSAVSWRRYGPDVALTWWADKRYDAPHRRESPGWDRLPRLTPWHMTSVAQDRPLPSTLQIGTLLPPEMAERLDWSMDGRSVAVRHEGWTAEQLRPKIAPDAVAAWTIAALRIMAQPLATVTEQGLPANVRKAFHKRPVRVKKTRITVIEFRRRVGDRDVAGGREYSHRFLRRGHWRKQWYGSLTAGDRRQVRIWIHPTLVGPEDKPIMFRDHVNALTR